MEDSPASAPRSDAADRLLPDTRGGVRLPADALRRLSRHCGELGTGSIAALRDAGRSAGRRLVENLQGGEGTGEGAGSMALERFWRELAEVAAGAGFGRVEYRVRREDVGQVEVRGSPEVGPGGSDDGPAATGCHFACGWIGGALSTVAGEPVAVLEVECAAGSGAETCRFLVGPERRLEEIRSSLRSGAGSLAEAVEER